VKSPWPSLPKSAGKPWRSIPMRSFTPCDCRRSSAIRSTGRKSRRACSAPGAVSVYRGRFLQVVSETL
jgi:hypothetical protein